MSQIGDPLGRTGELCLQSQPLEAIEPAQERIRAAIACATALLLSVGPFAYSETARILPTQFGAIPGPGTATTSQFGAPRHKP